MRVRKGSGLSEIAGLPKLRLRSARPLTVSRLRGVRLQARDLHVGDVVYDGATAKSVKAVLRLEPVRKSDWDYAGKVVVTFATGERQTYEWNASVPSAEAPF